MALRITIDIFSGRENPVIELRGREAKEVIERLQPTRKIKKRGIRASPAPIQWDTGD